MAEGLNKAILVGNLGMDPELKFTESGTALLRIRMATTESYIDRHKERQQRTEWHSVVVWGNRGEALNKILGKGRSVCVEGRIQTRSWEDKDGNKRYSTEVVATNVVLLPDGKRNEPGESPKKSAQGGYGPDYGDDFGDDDIPFAPLHLIYGPEL